MESSLNLKVHLHLRASAAVAAAPWPVSLQNGEARASVRHAEAFWLNRLADLAPALKDALRAVSPATSFPGGGEESLCVDLCLPREATFQRGLWTLRVQTQRLTPHVACVCEAADFFPENQGLSSQSAAEEAVAVEAAGGTLSDDVDASLAAAEFENLKKLLEVEPACSAAVEAKCVGLSLVSFSPLSFLQGRLREREKKSAAAQKCVADSVSVWPCLLRTLNFNARR